MNLCGAFEKPVRKSPEGYAEPSKTALKQYAQQVYACYADAPAQSFAVGIGLDELAPAHAPEPDAHRAGTCRKGEAARK